MDVALVGQHKYIDTNTDTIKFIDGVFWLFSLAQFFFALDNQSICFESVLNI